MLLNFCWISTKLPLLVKCLNLAKIIAVSWYGSDFLQQWDHKEKECVYSWKGYGNCLILFQLKSSLPRSDLYLWPGITAAAHPGSTTRFTWNTWSGRPARPDRKTPPEVQVRAAQNIEVYSHQKTFPTVAESWWVNWEQSAINFWSISYLKSKYSNY